MTEKFDEKSLEEKLKKNLADADKPTDLESFDNEDDDQNFIRKDEPTEEKSVEKDEEVQGIVKRLKNIFFPENNQQRNLARETGGLEAKKDKGISEKDVWDGRSEEVDKMGSTKVFETSGMRSVVWKKKKERLEAAKIALEAAEVGVSLKGKAPAKNAISAPTQGYIARLKNLRQDRSGINDNGMSR